MISRAARSFGAPRTATVAFCGERAPSSRPRQDGLQTGTSASSARTYFGRRMVRDGFRRRERLSARVESIRQEEMVEGAQGHQVGLLASQSWTLGFEFTGFRARQKSEHNAIFSEGRGEKINHQANRGLGGATAGIAIGIDLDDVEADELALGGNLLHQLVDLGKAEAARLVGSRAGCERWVHGIDIERDINVLAARNRVDGRG